jgi:hypothetical protein
VQSKEIIGLINSQIPFDNGTLSRLANVMEEYPYFQAAHLLYTLNLQSNKDTQLPAETRKTACYMGDRKNFFYRLESGFSALLYAESGQENHSTTETQFDLIDRFLEKKEKEIKRESTSLIPNSPSVTGDYFANFSPEETHSPTLQASLMPHQDRINKFIDEDKKSGVRIVLDNRKTEPETLPPAIDKEIGSSFFSETLAKIYLKQKKYNKALEIIIKLSLVYPEKNAYFADQIRFLEKLIINIPK